MRLQLSVRSQVARSRYSSYGAQGDRVTSSSAPFRALSCISPSVLFLLFSFFPSLLPPTFSVFWFFFFFALFSALSTVVYWSPSSEARKELPLITKGLSWASTRVEGGCGPGLGRRVWNPEEDRQPFTWPHLIPLEFKMNYIISKFWLRKERGTFHL